MVTYDINTSDETVDGTPSGETFRPLRYTETTRDGIRVGLWTLLSTVRGTHRLNLEQGIDAEAILDPATSDGERAALVADVVASYPGVVSISQGPTVTVDDGEVSITLRAETTDGPIELSV